MRATNTFTSTFLAHRSLDTIWEAPCGSQRLSRVPLHHPRILFPGEAQGYLVLAKAALCGGISRAEMPSSHERASQPSSFLFLIFLFIYLFIWLHQVLVAACGFPDQGSNPGPLHWECRVFATGPPGKSATEFLILVFVPTSDPCGVERGKVLTRAEARAALSPGKPAMQPDAGPQGCFLLSNLVTIGFEGSDPIVLPI